MRRSTATPSCAGSPGPGKSYALGVLIEQLLIDTELPMIVLDPNGDFVGLGYIVDDAAPEDRARLDAAQVAVFGATEASGSRLLRVRFNDMSIEAKAAILELDPWPTGPSTTC